MDYNFLPARAQHNNKWSPGDNFATGKPEITPLGLAGEDCDFSKIRVNGNCVCPYSTAWNGSVCVPTKCSSTNHYGYCDTGQICVQGNCKEMAVCTHLTNDGCFTCANAGDGVTMKHELPSRLETAGTSPNLSCTDDSYCQTNFQNYCVLGNCTNPSAACSTYYNSDPTKYTNYKNCEDPRSKTWECRHSPAANPPHFVCDCRDKLPTPTYCKNTCNQMYPCDKGKHCSPSTNQCVPNNSSVCSPSCPPTKVCERGVCVCEPGACKNAEGLLDSILTPIQCPPYLLGVTDVPKKCFMNYTTANLTDINGTTLPPKSPLLSAFDMGIPLQFDGAAINTNSGEGVSQFVEQSYTGEPSTTNLQVLFSDKNNYQTLSPQQCSLLGCSDGAGGLPCSPGTTAVRVSPFYINPNDSEFPGDYFSIWGCQQIYGQCPKYFTPQIVNYNNSWQYGCTRNPLPTAELCRTIKTNSYCGSAGACDETAIASQNGYCFGDCRTATSTACVTLDRPYNPESDDPNHFLVRDKFYQEPVLPGTFVMPNMKASAGDWEKTKASDTWPIGSYYMYCDETPNQANCSSPEWTAMQESSSIPCPDE